MARDSENSQKCHEPEGRYANYFEIGHSASEFVLQFGQYYEDRAKPRLHTRIIVSPMYVKELLKILMRATELYGVVSGGNLEDGECELRE